MGDTRGQTGLNRDLHGATGGQSPRRSPHVRGKAWRGDQEAATGLGGNAPKGWLWAPQGKVPVGKGGSHKEKTRNPFTFFSILHIKLIAYR